MWDTIIVEKSDGIATLTINRPAQLNSLDDVMLRELHEAVVHINHLPDIDAVIVTGAGDKAFVAGADISLMSKLTPQEAQVFGLLGQAAFNSLENLEQPVIAAVNGYCLGGGCELALACDIRISSEKAKFGQPEVGLGILAAFGGTQRLPRLIGPGRAKYMLLTGDIIDAQKAQEFGLVDMVVPHADVMKTAQAMAQTICKQQRFAVRQTKRCVNYGMDGSLSSGLAYEIQAYGMCYLQPERTSAMIKFMEDNKNRKKK